MSVAPTRVFPPGRRGHAPSPHRLPALQRKRASDSRAGGTDVLVVESWSSVAGLFVEGSSWGMLQQHAGSAQRGFISNRACDQLALSSRAGPVAFPRLRS